MTFQGHNFEFPYQILTPFCSRSELEDLLLETTFYNSRIHPKKDQIKAVLDLCEISHGNVIRQNGLKYNENHSFPASKIGAELTNCTEIAMALALHDVAEKIKLEEASELLNSIKPREGFISSNQSPEIRVLQLIRETLLGVNFCREETNNIVKPVALMTLPKSYDKELAAQEILEQTDLKEKDLYGRKQVKDLVLQGKLKKQIFGKSPLEFHLQTAKLCGFVDYMLNNDVTEDCQIQGVLPFTFKERQMQAFYRALFPGRILYQQLNSNCSQMRPFFSEFSIDNLMIDQYLPRIINGLELYGPDKESLDQNLIGLPDISNNTYGFWEMQQKRLN